MSTRKRISSWFIPLFILLLIFVLAACANEEAAPTPASVESNPDTSVVAETPVVAEEIVDAPAADSQPSAVNQAPIGLHVKSAPSPAIDPACLAGGKGFQLLGASLPATGLEPGVDQLFCATGAPEGTMVVFTLVDPNGKERSEEVASSAQGDTTIAPFSVRLLADDAPGAWTLRASSGDDGAMQAELAFDVQAPTRPFITLLEPIENNTDVIRAGIGGLLPESTARFALYTLDAVNVGESGEVENQANLLISTRLVADSTGRADLELDVADLPAGPYLLLLIPPDADLGSPPILSLPDQARLAITANLTRSEVVAVPDGTSETTAETGAAGAEQPSSGEGQSMMPKLVETTTGVPRGLQLNLPVTELPSCLTTSTPTLQIWPTTGEIGDWWYGCATGFAPGKDVEFVVTLPSGEQTQFNLEADANGTTPFRWYAAPGEGAGQYKVLAKNGAGQAELAWDIAEASKPHILVFPHNFQSKVGGELYLSGFPAQQEVKIGLFQIGEQGQAAKVKQWKVTTNNSGFYGARFSQTEDLKQGHYALIAQSKPAFQFPGVDTPASAIEFFSFNTAPKSSNDAYTLFLGRPAETLIAAQPTAEPEPTPAPEEQPAEAVEEPAATPVETTADSKTAGASETPAAPAEEPAADTPAATAVTEVPPPTYSVPKDAGETPSCPDATPGEPSVCMLPATMQQGTFAYLLMHDFKPRTKFNVTIIAPNGKRETLARRTTDADGAADAYWYALHGEPLGEYKINIRGGGENFSGNLVIIEPTSPHLVIQPRSPKAGSNITASVTGFDANEDLLFAFYRSENIEDGNVNFKLLGKDSIRTDDKGGATKQFRTARNQKGVLFLILVYRSGQSEPAAQAVYQPGKPLHLQYPFAWGQNFQEGQ
jgi:5-hydroxyisourate hydrolase-like protein (transthyretin family)